MKFVAVTDTSLEELAARQDAALERLEGLLEGVDERLPVPGTTWTVRETVAHLAGTAGRYATMDPEHVASTPRGVDSLNDADLRSQASSSLQELRSALQSNHQALKQVNRRRASGERIPFHAGLSLSPLAAGGEWLGELVIHGRDIARASRRRWPIRSRDALLIALFAFEVMPGYLDISRIGRPLRVAVRLLGGRPQAVTLGEGAVAVEDLMEGFPAQVRFLSTPQAWILDGYGRVSLAGAILRGLLVVGGKQPWRALDLQKALVAP